MTWEIKRNRGFMPDRGIALLTSGGCLGSTYGEPGDDMVREFKVVFLWWSWSMNLRWKRTAPAMPTPAEKETKP